MKLQNRLHFGQTHHNLSSPNQVFIRGSASSVMEPHFSKSSPCLCRRDFTMKTSSFPERKSKADFFMERVEAKEVPEE